MFVKIPQQSSAIVNFLALTVVIATAAIPAQSAVSADEPTLRGITDASRKAAQDHDEKLRMIVHRQRGDQLSVYLNSRGAYVNGKSVSRDDLSWIVSETGLKAAVLTAEPYLAKERIAGWEKTVRNAGIKKIDLATVKQQTSRKDENLRKILSRQQGDQLKVYLKGTRGIYINGTSVSSDGLAKIIRESGMEQVVLTAEPYLSRERLAQVEEVIESAGGKNIQLTTPKAN